MNYEQSGEMKKALNYRVRALDEYIAIIKIDEDENRKRTLRMKVKQGIATAETLKRRNILPPTTISPSSDHCTDIHLFLMVSIKPFSV